MYSAMMGFDGHIIDRINYWEKDGMEATQTLEFMWQPTVSCFVVRSFVRSFVRLFVCSFARLFVCSIAMNELT